MIDFELLNALIGATFALILILIFIISIACVFKFADYMIKENNKDKKALKKEIIDDIKKDINNGK